MLANWIVDLSEAATALYGLSVAKRIGYKNIHLEGDALNVIVVFKKMRGRAPIHLVFDSCFDVLSSFDCTMFSFVCSW